MLCVNSCAIELICACPFCCRLTMIVKRPDGRLRNRYYLYVLLDVFTRYVAGWMAAMRESAELAKRFIEESCRKQGIQPGQLTLHADRGTSMRSKSVAFLLADLGARKRIVGRMSPTTIRFRKVSFAP